MGRSIYRQCGLEDKERGAFLIKKDRKQYLATVHAQRGDRIILIALQKDQCVPLS